MMMSETTNSAAV